MDVLAPTLLWLGVVLLYGAWWWHVGHRGSAPRALRSLVGGGVLLLVAGSGAALGGAMSPGAALCSTLAHVMVACTLVAVLAPLARKPVWVMGLVAPVGLLMGVLERVS
ncbi:hypothetical protein MYSTI_02035 [Myxococcus stipitatus DSM 14675]|uniref:Uncharacterized protein n=1 Tax=Myxococcus stipitatus (strain DSM 14675 / JCM 12634 / Mx s8) TaxID=1278073 RepID=L7UA82_MYXSD|nr:hypothetical protein [Myxococcus stipitatus]AGC43364.1 hypothetical protein MYSTI_02035 [Myxococcus stipitatus DSM 14675]